MTRDSIVSSLGTVLGNGQITEDEMADLKSVFSSNLIFPYADDNSIAILENATIETFASDFCQFFQSVVNYNLMIRYGEGN